MESLNERVAHCLNSTSTLQVSHLAHLGGALAGVLLVLLLRGLPDAEDEQ